MKKKSLARTYLKQCPDLGVHGGVEYGKASWPEILKSRCFSTLQMESTFLIMLMTFILWRFWNQTQISDFRSGGFSWGITKKRFQRVKKEIIHNCLKTRGRELKKTNLCKSIDFSVCGDKMCGAAISYLSKNLKSNPLS